MLPELKKIDGKVTKRIEFPLSTPKERAHTRQDVIGFKDYTGVDPQAVAPIEFETNCEGKQVYFSKPYSYKGYPVVFAYVEDDKGELSPRLLYHSYSRAQWRIAPATRGKFGKGYGNDMDVNLSPELNISLSDFFKKEIAHPDTLESNKDMPGFIAGFTSTFDRGLEADEHYRAEVPMDMSGGKKIVEYPLDAFEKKRKFKAPPPGFGFKLKGEALPPGIRKKGSATDAEGLAQQVSLGFKSKKKSTAKGNSVLVDASSCPLTGEETFLPDFESGLLFKTAVENPFYTAMFHTDDLPDKGMTLFCVLSKDKQYEYLIAECEKGGEPYRFVLTAANHPSQMSSFLVPREFVSLGHRMVFPAVRAGEDLLTMHQPEVNPERPDFVNPMTSSRDIYIDVSPYVAKLPMNAYLNQLPTLEYSDAQQDDKRPGVQ